MTVRNKADHGDLLEFSVIYTDRAINMLSDPFQAVMRDLARDLKATYNAKHLGIIPGSGTYAMEAVCRQFATNKKAMVLRNGYFSYRWTQIIECGSITDSCTILTADFDSNEINPQLKPHDVEKVLKRIEEERPDVIFAPQVETSTGVILSEEYITKVSEAVHKYGGILVIDSIAAGTIFVDIEKLGVDVLVSAPQKGWSGPSCCGLVLLNEHGYAQALKNSPTSFSCNLLKWLEVVKKYEDGGAMYHTTLPTDSLTAFRNSVKETLELGRDVAMERAIELGSKIRAVCQKHGLKSVAHANCSAPTVVVSYTKIVDIVKRFKEHGMQVVGGVPFKIGEPEDLVCFRVGLFGLDKLKDVEGTVRIFEEKLLNVLDS